MKTEKIAIVGAGLVGSLEAILLAKRGVEVHVFERRPDLRKASLIGGRSINLALSVRGWKAITLAGIKQKIEDIAIPMHSRMMHDVSGNLTPQAYGKSGQAIYSVSRGELNRQLLLEAEKYENVHFYFNHRCLDINLDTAEIYFENQDTSEQVHYQFDRIIGADGAFSAIRNKMQKTDRFNYSQFYLEHGYKELSIPANSAGKHQLEPNYLHIWPRGNYMLIALANLDGSFTCTLFFPFEGKNSFNALTTPADVNRFFEQEFADAKKLMPNLTNEFFENPTSSLVTVRCNPWNYGTKVLLIGDASHAIVPFYGQGMNSGFEDCFVLEQFLNQYDQNWDVVVPEFAKHRKPDGDAISELALQNFIEMRDKVANSKFLLQKKIERKIFDKYPNKWVPLYSMVTFNDEFRYSEAWNIGQKQEKIMQQIMATENIENIWDSSEIEARILEQL